MSDQRPADIPVEAPRPRRNRFRLGILSCSLLGFILVLLGSYVRRQISQLPELRTVKIERRDLRITVGTTGTIEPEEVVEVGARVAGVIEQLGADPRNRNQQVDVGTSVRKGAVLVQLETELYKVAREKALAATQLAEAEIGRLRTQLGQAQRILDRARRLRKTNSESDFDKILTAHEMGKSELAIGLARLAQATAVAKQAEINLARTTIRSPIDGVIIDRRVNLGQSVSPATPALFLIARDLKRMRVRASVSETDIGKVFVGQVASFEVDAYRDQTLNGRVEKIQLNARTQGNFVTYDVLIRIEPGATKLLPHMTADVEFEIIRRENAWLVPSAALKWKPAASQIDPRVANRESFRGDRQRGQNSNKQVAFIWVPAGRGLVRPLRVKTGIDDGVLTEVVGKDFRKNMPVVVGKINRTVLARIIPSAKTVR